MFRNSQAFTLVETVMGIVIISIAMTGTLLAFQIVTRSSADPMIYQQATSIGKSYIEEVASRSYPTILPCPVPPVGGRSVYENICDYNNLTDIGARDQNGQAITGLENYTVNVAFDTTTAALGLLTPGTQVIRIDVTVSHTSIPNLLFSTYRTQR
ncbi:MAG: type II secretion system protein [Francisellaceae bacterium]|jgi:MSHA pilin protein MshD|nr:type II secretion system protein [Francisellaceae bacterium]MBT6207821.1 type II secretion system protein [Francisellaceae bacterium]MBT6538849.1 type II secretion system protein [Francisellaceae bacterium]